MRSEEIRYFVKKPSGTRKTFGLVPYYLVDRKTKSYDVELPASVKNKLVSVNNGFRNGTYSEAVAGSLIREIIKAEYRKQGI